MSGCARLAMVGMVGWAVFATALWLVGCGGPEPDEPSSATPPEAPGTYVLDLVDWRERASVDVSVRRWADISKQSVGSDPFYMPDGKPGNRESRPERPKPRGQWSDEEFETLETETLAWLAEEAEALVERLVLHEDGSFAYSHASRASKGGSINFGILGRRVAMGTWARDGEKLVLTVTEAGVPDERMIELEMKLPGRLRDDGAIELDAMRDGFRDQISVYRRE